MIRFPSSLLVLVFLLACQQAPEQKEETILEAEEVSEVYVERLDPALRNIIATNATVEILAEGFDWTEGPLWLETEGRLIFSDIPPNTVFAWVPGQGVTTYLKPSGYTGAKSRIGEPGSNGLLLDPTGRLVLCQHGDRRVAVMEASLGDPQPVYRTVVDNYEGKRLNSPNDATYSSTGDLYFTDPPYGLEGNVNDPSKELSFQGVYRFTARNGLQLLTDQLSRPNGIALNPDETKLYVANSDPERAIWMEYNLQDDGTLDEGKVFYDATALVGLRKGLPDGLKVHPSGTIFATGPGGVWIFNPDGRHLGTIHTGQATSNCALGNNNKFLYITADMYLMRIALL